MIQTTRVRSVNPPAMGKYHQKLGLLLRMLTFIPKRLYIQRLFLMSNMLYLYDLRRRIAKGDKRTKHVSDIVIFWLLECTNSNPSKSFQAPVCGSRPLRLQNRSEIEFLNKSVFIMLYPYHRRTNWMMLWDFSRSARSPFPCVARYSTLLLLSCKGVPTSLQGPFCRLSQLPRRFFKD